MLQQLDQDAFLDELGRLKFAFVNAGEPDGDPSYVWQEAKIAVKRLRAILPADMDTASIAPFSLCKFAVFLDEVWEIHRMYEDSGEINHPVAQHDWERIASFLKEVAAQSPEANESRQVESASRRRMTHDEIESKARRLIVLQGNAFLDKTAKQWASEIGCSASAVRKTRLWRNTMKVSGRGRARRDRGARPPKHIQPVTLSKAVEARAGKHDRDAVLDKLIADQTRDDTFKIRKTL